MTGPDRRPGCPKAAHDKNITGYLHAADDDRPYDVDGVIYCGRCHRVHPCGGESIIDPAAHAALEAERDLLLRDIDQRVEVHRHALDEKDKLEAAHAAAVEALEGIVQDFESDYVLDGVIVDDPGKVRIAQYESARAALAGKAVQP